VTAGRARRREAGWNSFYLMNRKEIVAYLAEGQRTAGARCKSDSSLTPIWMAVP
jgi:hypothetical protein